MTLTQTPPLSKAEIQRELRRCAVSRIYFIHNYCKIFDALEGDWIPFRLWPAQVAFIKIIHIFQLSIALKARQLGLTWIGLGCILWEMLFRPAASCMVFSLRDNEAMDLLQRLKDMYARLPDWMQARSIVVDNAHQFGMSNGSIVRALPTTAGDSYSCAFVLIDEADLVPNLNRLLGRVKPTIDAGGKLVLISRANKSLPNSTFKRIYKAAKDGLNSYGHLFIPWHARPGRTPEWYEQQKADIFERTGAHDDLYEQYPETDAEALAPRSLDKRIPAQWLNQCYVERRPLPVGQLAESGAPAVADLCIYELPQRGHRYVIGADPAEGNPTSDDSACIVKDRDTGESVARLSERLEPSVFADYIAQLSVWYNGASALVERNNHGHAVILWLRDNSRVFLLPGLDKKHGWLSNSLGKTTMYNTLADALRDQTSTLYDFKTYTQVASIEGATLRAPEQQGAQYDDCADAEALATQAIILAEISMSAVRHARVRFGKADPEW